ncbi:O-methyltransferase family 2 [Kribbella flavida DSM 17836]|uniref:O-methyltransferase family 2 n=1 Tax=Kribbella flavida (strain DSM 17836 / JCM 10339 / NBRC 14399) TaxID=479435 RepID=D2PT09_KRIFD|nr:methyltransferase [Kribbella flavida]ADB35061.1 O-methyltransferase family 2 [Kribbella flavida DSM 17836]
MNDRPEALGLLEFWAMTDLVTPMALRTVATLRIADLLAGGPRDLKDLAVAASCDADALGRVLRYLAARGIFVALADDRFELGGTARWMLDDDPSAARRWLDQDGYGATMDRAHLDLLGIVRRGGPVEAANKTSLDATAAASYDQLMAANTRNEAPLLVRAIDWGRFEHIVDVGGGTGVQLGAILTAFPQTRGTLVELPASVEAAERQLAGTGLTGRCDILAGNLFDLELPAADAFLLRMLLHSFEDEQAVEALSRCRRALRPGGAIFVAEAADTHQEAFTTMDLIVLVLGHGRERSLTQYDELAAAAGLRRVAIHTPPAGPRALEYTA